MYFLVACTQILGLSGQAPKILLGIVVMCITIVFSISSLCRCCSLCCHCRLVFFPRLPPLRLLSLCALALQHSIRDLLDPRNRLPGCNELYNMREGGGVWRRGFTRV